VGHHLLADRNAPYEADGTLPTKDALTARFKGRGGDAALATTVPTLATRLTKALKWCLPMKALSLPCGFPRFKTPTGWHRIPLRHAPGWWLDEDGSRWPPIALRSPALWGWGVVTSRLSFPLARPLGSVL